MLLGADFASTGADSERAPNRACLLFTCLLLQFPYPFQAAPAMTGLSDLLVVTPPAGPGQNVIGPLRRGPDEPDEQAADFRDGDRNVAGAVGSPFLRAPMVNAAKATNASVRCRYQPCQLRTS